MQRLDRAVDGNFGDCHPVGRHVWEMRIHHGPGYRVYYSRVGSVVYVILAGGTKRRQSRDITAAEAILDSYLGGQP